MRTAAVVAVAVLGLCPIALAGDAPTPTPQDVAARYISEDAAVRATAEQQVAEATPEFLRQVLAATRALLRPDGGRVVDPIKIAPSGASTDAPDLPPPAALDRNTRGVTFDVRFLTLAPDLARQLLGADASATKVAFLPQTPQDVTHVLELIQKSESVQQISGTVTTVRDMQEATTEVMNKISYIADYDPDGGKWNPIVKSALDGVVFEAMPTILPDGKRIWLDLSIKLRRLTMPIEQGELVAPDTQEKLKVQLPETTTAGWAKPILIADGGSLLVGGWDLGGCWPEGRRVLAVLLSATKVDLAESRPPPAGPAMSGDTPPR